MCFKDLTIKSFKNLVNALVRPCYVTMAPWDDLWAIRMSLWRTWWNLWSYMSVSKMVKPTHILEWSQVCFLFSVLDSAHPSVNFCWLLFYKKWQHLLSGLNWWDLSMLSVQLYRKLFLVCNKGFKIKWWCETMVTWTIIAKIKSIIQWRIEKDVLRLTYILRYLYCFVFMQMTVSGNFVPQNITFFSKKNILFDSRLLVSWVPGVRWRLFVMFQL